MIFKITSNVIIVEFFCIAVISGLFLLATPSSFPLSTTTITNPTTTSSTRDIISTSSVVTTSSSQVAQPTSTVIRQPTPPSITDPEALSGAGLLSPVHYVILLLSLFITCILTL